MRALYEGARRIRRVGVRWGLVRSLPEPGVDTGEGWELTVTRRDADGMTLSLSGRLSASQWRQALPLLERRP